MAKYINADALVKRIDKELCKPCRDENKDYNGVRCRACWVDDMLIWIDSEPTADVRAVKHGHWTASYNDGDGFVVCSNCKRLGIELIAWRKDYAKNRLRYCPNCGTYMRGK